MLKNKKGFTLIEILAAITILGILTGIAVVSVTKIIQNGKEEHYNTAEENLTLAGQSYAQQNRDVLPKAIGQKTKVSLQTLVDSNYIQPIKDYSDNDCDLEKSYVQIYKYSQTDYSYVAYLECPNYNSRKAIDNITPEITASINVDEKKSTATATVTLKGNDKLASYSYIVYRNGKEVKNTGNTSIKGYKESLTFNISLTDYTPGNIKVIITAVNTYGETATKTIAKNIKDSKGPTCIIKTEDQTTSAKTWTNQNRKITVGCDDGDGSGCQKDEYSTTFKTTTKNGVITIYDEEGNSTNCNVSVYVDKTAPSCTNDGDKTTWTSANRTIYYGCSDSDSGCDTNYSGGSQTINYTAKTATIAAYTIKDNAGNTVNCPARTANVYVDMTPPTCTVTGGSDKWTNGSRKITATCSDDDSGCKTASFSKTYSTEINTTTAGAKGNNNGGTVTDKAGNTADCSANQTVKIDTTAPTCSVSGGSSTWINATSTTTSRTITAKCSDTGGSGCATADFSKTYSTDINTTKAGAVGDGSGGSVSDNAGNTANCAANQTVKIDKTYPTISCNANNASAKYCDTETLTSKSGCTAYGTLPSKSCTGTIVNNVFTAGTGGSISSRSTAYCDDTGNCTSPDWRKSAGRCVSGYCTAKVTGTVCDAANNCVTKEFIYYLKY